MLCRTTSNIKRKQTIEAEAPQNDNSSSASTSTSSVRELVDTVKPAAKQTKRYKEQTKLETKLIEYLDHEQAVQVQEQPATQARSNDLVDLHVTTIAAMIRQRLNSEQQNDLLPKLFNFINQSITQYEAGRQGFAGVGAHGGNVAGPMMQELNSPMIQPREQQQNNPYMYNFTEL